ncbi:hypothetical protein QP027_10130 [Corynebacterium breve]|uniref:Uncharacterized protein n=1 Tax=Corynebacterium breve TaxID=3049799 RepID=A0ABY8VEC3_9CORY|nr:hypothetical protein [Corynebacterium breve]WIM67447.1 hypothetical protein QP027_10130 [Corynebacterium breve]
MSHLSFSPSTAKKIRAAIPLIDDLTATNPLSGTLSAVAFSTAATSWLERINAASNRAELHAQDVSAFLDDADRLDHEFAEDLK